MGCNQLSGPARRKGKIYKYVGVGMTLFYPGFLHITYRHHCFKSHCPAPTHTSVSKDFCVTCWKSEELSRANDVLAVLSHVASWLMTPLRISFLLDLDLILSGRTPVCHSGRLTIKVLKF